MQLPFLPARATRLCATAVFARKGAFGTYACVYNATSELLPHCTIATPRRQKCQDVIKLANNPLTCKQTRRPEVKTTTKYAIPTTRYIQPAAVNEIDSSCLTKSEHTPRRHLSDQSEHSITCVGNVTYLSASYWHHELSMLETAGKEYSYANAFDLF